jgi:hypothetical protein
MIKFDTPMIQVVNKPTIDPENNKVCIDRDPTEDIIDNIVTYFEKLKKHNQTIQLLQGIYDSELGDDPPNALTFDMYSCTQQLTNRMVFSVHTRHQTQEATKENDTHVFDSTPTEPPKEEVPPEPPPNPTKLLPPTIMPLSGEIVEIFELEENLLSHDNDEQNPIKIVGQNKMFSPSKRDWTSI